MPPSESSESSEAFSDVSSEGFSDLSSDSSEDFSDASSHSSVSDPSSHSSESFESASSDSNHSDVSSASSMSPSSDQSGPSSQSSEEEDEPPPEPCCDCDCEKPEGQEDCPDDGSSGEPVKYGTGQMVHTETDLSSEAFGIPWGHKRSYANVLRGSGGNGSSLNGNRWYVRQLKALSFKFTPGTTEPTRIVVADGATSSQYFILVDGEYANEFTGWNSLVWNSGAGEYVLTVTRRGQQWVFADHNAGADAGQLLRIIDPAGRMVNLSYDGSNNLEKFEQVEDGQTSGFYYTWTTLNSIESVTLKLDDRDVKRVRFAYYEDGDESGSQDDLKNAIIEQYDRGTEVWKIVERKHYRYYHSGDPNGFASGMKLVIGAAAYQNMLNAGLNPETATEAELAGFADFYYEYDSDKRVTLEKVEGGRRTYTFTYAINPANDGAPNTWLTKTVETLPDGSENRVYTNNGYNVLVKILQEAVTANQWVDAYMYNDLYRPVQHAHPSAVDSVTEPSGGGTTLTVNLKSADGLIEVTDYYTADVPASGEVAGYVFTKGVKKGSGGTVEILQKLKYATQTVGSVSIHPIKEKLLYPVAGMSDADAPTTTFERSWYLDGSDPTFQTEQLTITEPEVSTDENGSGTAGVIKKVFDRFGRLTWEMNQRGVIGHRSYVQATGAPLQSIADVNTDLVPNPPSGWASSGMNLITDYVSDDQGRLTQTRGPWHEVQLRECDTAVTSIRRVEFRTYNDVARETRRAAGYMTGDDPTADFNIIGAVSVWRKDGGGRIIDEIQGVRCCTCGPLTPGELLPQDKWSRWTHRIYDTWGRLYSTRVYTTIPVQGEGDERVNYMQTLYGYDTMGRQNRVVDAARTIQRTVYDVRDQRVSQWIGTNDRDATDDDPTGGGAAGNNMKLVLALEYDGGVEGGDGNITQETRPVDATSGNDRVVTYGYDYRDRRETVTQTDGTTTWITKTTYDNLDHVTGTTRYRTSIADANRITQSRTFYDALGRVYKEETDGINPADGTDVTGAVKGEKWYDLAGNVIKQYQPGGTAFTKTIYDALNRNVISYLACRPGTAGVPSGDDNDVSSDTVMEQLEVFYDAGGNSIWRIQRQRLDDATGTGPLNTVTINPKARRSFTGIWPDAIGRVRVTADYGTNGGTSPGRPDIAPERSDTVLVTTNRYKDSGDSNAIIDPMGIETRWENDKAGRRIKLIEGIAPSITLVGTGCVPSVDSSGSCVPVPYPPSPTPRISEFVWHPSGQLSKLTLVNAETGDQITRWVFGTTLADSAIASNGLVRAKIYPESDDRPAPSNEGADGVYSHLEYEYNRQGQQTEFKDADGTTHEYAYNKLGQMTVDRVTAIAADLNSQMLRIDYAYDNRSLLSRVTSYNSPSGPGGGTLLNEVVLEYDSFLQLSADKQSHAGAVDGSTPKVTYAYETGGVKNTTRRVSTTYPNGRILNYLYGGDDSIDDHLSRVSGEQVEGETDPLVEYRYIGAARQVRVAYPGPDVMCDYKKQTGQPVGDAGDPYNGYDRFGRSVDISWISPIE